MGCACGKNGQGGCGGGGDHHAHDHQHQDHDQEAINQALFEEIKAEPAAELISTSEQEWPRIKVNGVRIEPEAIARELQYHPAASRDEAVFEASRALVIAELLRQRAEALGIKVNVVDGQTEEEAVIQDLIEQEVELPLADEETCRQFFEKNRERFSSAPLVAARHILLGCAEDDDEGRSLAMEKALQLIAELTEDGSRFGQLALAHSDCPSKEQGGALGQISKGQTVPEFERQLLRLPQGLAQQPIESRYGVHVVWVDQRLEGKPLPYEAVRETIRDQLDQRVWQTAVGQYLRGLVGAADIQGIMLEGADSPLVQ